MWRCFIPLLWANEVITMVLEYNANECKVKGYHMVGLPGLSRAVFFDGITFGLRKDGSLKGMHDMSRNDLLEKGQEILDRLVLVAPRFFDSSVMPSDRQCPNFFVRTSYDIPLELGVVSADVEVFDDLGADSLGRHAFKRHITDDDLTQFQDTFNGVAGLIFTGSYSWKGNEGLGLRLGRCGDGFSSRSGVSTEAFRKAMNAICMNTYSGLNRGLIQSDALGEPFHYWDGIRQLRLNMHDFSLEMVRAADKPVGEFMAWMHTHQKEVNSYGELVRLATECYQGANRYENSERHIPELSSTMHVHGSKMIADAVDVINMLDVLQNDRMKYLVQN